MNLLLAAFGAGMGAAVRFAVGHRLDDPITIGWPWGTLLVNTVGSLLLGAFSGLALSGAWLALLGAGFCGGLTTWSSLAVQTADRGLRLGSAYLFTTLTLALSACALGFWMALLMSAA